MVDIAVLLPTNTPAPMMPPMEIIARWRARRDLESFEDAGRDTSVAFKVCALVGGGGTHDTPAAPRFATIDRRFATSTPALCRVAALSSSPRANTFGEAVMTRSRVVRFLAAWVF